jgi:SWI/SNF-related matrix-associated actin-dependent regulator 1 of chromatin subfamily A
MKIQRDVARLMDRCEKISKTLAVAVERLMKEDELGGENGYHTGELVGQPSILNPVMKLTHYQILGLNWLNLMRKNNLNGVLADEMGLGKTIQVIAFIALLNELEISGPHLIVVPSSTLDNWVREFDTWAPTLEVAQYTGSQLDRRMLRIKMNDILEGKSSAEYPAVVLTTYNMAISTVEDKNFTKRIPFNYVVFDEAHMLKNCSTQRFEHLMKIRVRWTCGENKGEACLLG